MIKQGPGPLGPPSGDGDVYIDMDYGTEDLSWDSEGDCGYDD